MSMSYELMMRKKEQIMYATIKGSLTENDGVFSGFSDSNYLQINNINNFALADNWEILLKINSNGYLFGTNKRYGITFTKNKIYLSSNGTSWDIASGIGSGSAPDDCYIRLKFTGTQYIFDYSTDKITWTNSATVNSSTKITNTINSLILGYWYTNYYAGGSIDLSNSYIKLGSTKYKLQAVVGYTIVGSPTIVDGVVSGFSASNYVHILNFPTTYDSIEFVTKVKTNLTSASSSNSVFTLGNGSVSQNKFYLYFNSQQVIFKYRSTDNNTTKNLTVNYVSSANTFYYIRVKIYTNKIILGISTDKINWVEGEVADSIIMASSQDLRYGIILNNSWALDGSIDFNETYIKINNKLWFNGQQA